MPWTTGIFSATKRNKARGYRTFSNLKTMLYFTASNLKTSRFNLFSTRISEEGKASRCALSWLGPFHLGTIHYGRGGSRCCRG